MRHAAILFTLATLGLQPAAGFAEPVIDIAPSPCIHLARGYNARAIGHRDIWIRESLGKNRPALRLRTTCFNLDRVAAITVKSRFTCVDRGDTVIAQTLGGETQRCSILKMSPYDGFAEPGFN